MFKNPRTIFRNNQNGLNIVLMSLKNVFQYKICKDNSAIKTCFFFTFLSANLLTFIDLKRTAGALRPLKNALRCRVIKIDYIRSSYVVPGTP